GGAPVVEVEGRAYPVELRWRPVGFERGKVHFSQAKNEPDPKQGNTEHIAAVLDEISHDDPRGDVLIFLPGEREIRDAHQLLSRRQYRETEIMPLYARLSAGDQDRVFKPGVKRHSQRSQLERLHVEPISQAAADQRKGRCGRVGPGICYRLYDEADFASR